MNRDDEGFIKTPEELHLLPGVPEAVARLNAAGFVCIVVTNQSGIARGLFTEDALGPLHEKLTIEMAPAGAHLDGIYYCPHGPDDGCDCRKPLPGMITQAVQDHQIDPARSWLVGDRPGDIACGAAVGCRTILVLTGKITAYTPTAFSSLPDFVCADLPAAVETILSAVPSAS